MKSEELELGGTPGHLFLGICLERKSIPLVPIQSAPGYQIKIDSLFSVQLWLFLDSWLIVLTSSFSQGIIIRSLLPSFFSHFLSAELMVSAA